ncbi:polymorphic toxin-type HINT domain-containing protein [Micromonospora sp. CPCC 206060]|uniref:polymorphic toxin-type HINT domain-containing protein n=1 Tax=Micromonospora sp. CPCC 206060 TaxID=3122406 RepID=UPI002FEF1D82
MADGSTRPIEDLEEGDLVLATDPETGKTTVRVVTDTHINNDTDLTDITVEDGDGNRSVLNTTAHHPFWSEDRQEWIYAADLTVGEDLRSLDGEPLTVAAVASFTGAQVMYDLTVDTDHTYYMVAGNTPVLVHNCGEEEVRGAIQSAFPERNVRTGGDVRRPDGTQWTDHDVYDDDFVCEVACSGGVTGQVLVGGSA